MGPWIFRIFFVGFIAFLCGVVAFAFLAWGTMRSVGRFRGQEMSFLDASKETVKSVARRVKRKIYYEATVHNPDGDTVPDEWDDEFLGLVKKIF
jgi:hypothetical protein